VAAGTGNAVLIWFKHDRRSPVELRVVNQQQQQQQNKGADCQLPAGSNSVLMKHKRTDTLHCFSVKLTQRKTVSAKAHQRTSPHGCSNFGKAA
jgi:hypothetical protein